MIHSDQFRTPVVYYDVLLINVQLTRSLHLANLFGAHKSKFLNAMIYESRSAVYFCVSFLC